MPSAKAPQPGECSFRVLYTYHVGKASEWERMARSATRKWTLYFEKRNPEASPEWISGQVSVVYEVKSAIGEQQFHTREASKYGLGMIVEALGFPFSTQGNLMMGVTKAKG